VAVLRTVDVVLQEETAAPEVHHLVVEAHAADQAAEVLQQWIAMSNAAFLRWAVVHHMAVVAAPMAVHHQVVAVPMAAHHQVVEVHAADQVAEVLQQWIVMSNAAFLRWADVHHMVAAAVLQTAVHHQAVAEAVAHQAVLLTEEAHVADHAIPAAEVLQQWTVMSNAAFLRWADVHHMVAVAVLQTGILQAIRPVAEAAATQVVHLRLHPETNVEEAVVPQAILLTVEMATDHAAPAAEVLQQWTVKSNAGFQLKAGALHMAADVADHVVATALHHQEAVLQTVK
jgi:hypothetical protein